MKFINSQMLPMRIFLILLYLPLLFCDGVPKKLRRYKVCNGRHCRSVRSFISPEYLFDIDSFLYTGWSRWSPCSRKCVTNRYRACRFPSICGERIMIHEEAFCYRRGTHCEFIFQNSRRDFIPDDSDYLDHSDVGFQSQSQERSSVESLDSAGSISLSHRPTSNIVSRHTQPQNGTGTGTLELNGGRRYVTITGGGGSSTRLPSATSSNQNQTLNTSYFSRSRPSQSNPSHNNNNNNNNNNHHHNHNRFRDPRLRQPRTNSDDEDFSQCGVARSTENEVRGIALRILGGQEARKGRWPWQVAVLNRMQEAFCGGTLIAPRWILTAAHCVRRRIHVTIGEHHLHRNEGTEKRYRIDAAFIHPDFDPDTVNNDIALLLLPEPVSVEAGLACLPGQQQQLPTPDTLCTILGWGKEKHTHIFGTTVLHEGKVPIVTTSECRFTYPYEITNNMFCAGYKGGIVDSCAGDSGGPILCSVNNRWTVFGVTSFGDGCGRKGKYGIYAKVPNYVSWIKKVMQANEYLN